MNVRRGSRGLRRTLPRTTLIWVAVIVVALIVVDVVLVALALGRTAPEERGPAGPIPTYSAGPVATPSASASATASPANAAAAPTSRLLSALDGNEAWRSSSGSCSVAQAVLEHSVDGGATWVAVPLSDDVRTVTALHATTSGLSILAGTGANCTPTVRTSVDDGLTWKAGAPGAAGAGTNRTDLALSTGRVASPCAGPVAAYQGQYTTLVACQQQVAWRTGTAAWVTVPLAGVQSIADAGNTYTLARTGASTCRGLQIVSLPATRVTASSSVSPVGCWDEGSSDSPVAISLAGTALWAWTADTVAVSVDGGATW